MCNFYFEIMCSVNGASQFVAYWAADSSALQVANFIGSMLFTIPMYFIAGLRPGYSKCPSRAHASFATTITTIIAYSFVAILTA